MSWGKYRIVLPETKEVLLTVAWGSITEAVAVSDMIGSHSCRPEDHSRSYIVNLYVGNQQMLFVGYHQLYGISVSTRDGLQTPRGKWELW